jgi:tetratricopeptide (TPR) repeat protein
MDPDDSTETASSDLSVSPKSQLALGRYLLGSRLGAGAVGSVFQATDTTNGSPVVVKFFDGQEDGFSPWASEMRLVLRFKHPNIVPCLDTGFDEGYKLWVLVFEHAKGGSLRRLLASGKQLSALQIARILCDTASALAYAHSQGVVHRDVKPENIVAQREGEDSPWLLTDFGSGRFLARGEVTRSLAGSLEYMAPEILTTGATAAVDQFSLGVMGLELWLGRLPPHRERAEQVALLRGSSGLIGVIARLAAADPEQRFLSMGEAAAVLSQALDRMKSGEDLVEVLLPHLRNLPGLPEHGVLPLLAEWDGRSGFLDFLVGRGLIERAAARTIEAIRKGYVDLPLASVFAKAGSAREGAAGHKVAAAREVAAVPKVVAAPEVAPIPTVVEAREVAAVHLQRVTLSARVASDLTRDYGAELAALIDAADAVGWPPLQVEVLGTAARGFSQHDDWHRAEIAYERGFHRASEFDAALGMITVGEHTARPTDALSWVRHAEAALARGPDPRRAAELLKLHGEVLQALGRLDEAEAMLRRAVAALPPDANAEERATAKAMLGNLLASQWRFAEARPLYEDALREDLPPRPRTQALNGLGAVLVQSGDLEGGARIFEQAVAFADELELTSDMRWSPWVNLAVTYGELGQTPRAIAMLREAFAATQGVGRPVVADHEIEYNLGLLHLRERQFDVAAQWAQRIVDDPEASPALQARALWIAKQARLGLGDPASALRLWLRRIELDVALRDVENLPDDLLELLALARGTSMDAP